MINATIAAVVLAAMLGILVLGVLALLIFWQLVTSGRGDTPKPSALTGKWWSLLVGIATLLSATVAVLNYIQ